MKFNRVILAAVGAVGLIGSVEAGPTPYCIAVGGGFLLLRLRSLLHIRRNQSEEASRRCDPTRAGADARQEAGAAP